MARDVMKSKMRRKFFIDQNNISSNDIISYDPANDRIVAFCNIACFDLFFCYSLPSLFLFQSSFLLTHGVR